MPIVHFILPEGELQTVEAKEGWSLMEVARDAGIVGIVAECGGRALCSTCHVHLDGEWVDKVGPPNDLEQLTLELAVDVDGASRLSCQLVIGPEHEGLRVRVPAHQTGY